MAQTTGAINGHEWVNLGLSVKWATCNVGASSPSDYGNYCAWGETNTKSEYTQENSKTYGKSIGNIVGNSQYDVALANWGGTWRLPTAREIDELIEKCEWTWITIKGHNGCKVTGPNGNSIFLPAAGLRYRKDIMGKDRVGYYWSSTPRDEHYTTYTCLLRFVVCNDYTCMSESREMGIVIRPVLGLETEEATYVVINEGTSNKGDDSILDVPEESAEFPGNVFAWLAKNVRYPDACLDEGFQGKVVVSFVIAQDGSITDVIALLSPHEELSKEAERVIKTMPKWKPARQGGKPVRMRYTLPIIFKIN